MFVCDDIKMKTIHDIIGTTLTQIGNESPDKKLTFETILKDKSDEYKGNYQQLHDIMQKSKTGKIVGYIEEVHKGKFISGFMKGLLTQDENKYKIINFGDALSDILMAKDTFEISTISKICEFTSQTLKYFQRNMESLINSETTKKHSEMAENLLKVLDNPKLIKSPLKKDNLDVCYDPIIQSGGIFKLKINAASDERNLYYDHGGIICMLGYRLRDYCSNIARTFLIDPSMEQKAVYNILITAYKRCLLKIRNYVELNKVYAEALKVIKKSKKPELEKNFLKNVGWGIGLELRDKNYVINKRNKKTAKNGMVFYLQVGFDKLIDTSKQKKGLPKEAYNYSLIIGDTIVITDDQPKFLTKFSRKLIDYQLSDEENIEETKEQEIFPNAKRKNKQNKPSKPSKPMPRPNKNATKPNMKSLNIDFKDDSFLPAFDNPFRRITRQSNRRAMAEVQAASKARNERETNQRKLRILASNRLQKILDENDGDFGLNNNILEYSDPACYDNFKELPINARGKRCSIDEENECVLCPIMDHIVPFHIKTIKNVSISSSGENTYLRINFVSPMAIINSRQVKQPDVAIIHKELMFVKELTYGSMDGDALQYVFIKIKSIQKNHKNKRKSDTQAPLVTQDRLKRLPNKNMLILNDLTGRPTVGGRKKGTGRLEAHMNGFRFSNHLKSNDLFVLYNNIKSAFFQKAQNTAAVIIHFHLINKVKIGKKITNDFQIYRDVIDRCEDIKSSGYDYDGMRQEREEKLRINRYNKQFFEYVNKCEELCKKYGYINVKFEEPEMDLSFIGVPQKQSIKIYPTNNCLIALEDNPPFAINTKNDVEMAHFERVAFSLREFDLVLIYKDFLKEPLRISSIPRKHLETLQEFINWQGIAYSQGQANLDWSQIIKNIRNDLSGFIASGGWNFLMQQQSDLGLPAQINENKTNNKSRKHNKKHNKNNDSDGDFVMSGSEYEPTDSEDAYESDDDSFDDLTNNNNFENDEDIDDNENYNDIEFGEDWEDLHKIAEIEDNKTKQKEKNMDFYQTRASSNRPRKKQRRIQSWNS